MADELEPTYLTDLEERIANGNKSRQVLSTSDQAEAEDPEPGRSYAVTGNDISDYSPDVSPEYKTYANDTEQPLRSDSGAQKTLEDRAFGE